MPWEIPTNRKVENVHLDGKTILYNCPLAPEEKKSNFIAVQLLKVLSAHNGLSGGCNLSKSKTNQSLKHEGTLLLGQVYPVEKQNTSLCG